MLNTKFKHFHKEKRGAIALTPLHKDEIRSFKWIMKIRYINRHHHQSRIRIILIPSHDVDADFS